MSALLIATQRHSHLQPQYALKDGKSRVGRHPDNEIALMLESVSRFHAEVVKQGNFYLLEDCQSRNGTYLNGDRLTSPAPIRQGDRIQFGNVEFIFRLDELEEDSAQSATDTNVSFATRGPKQNVLESKKIDDVAMEMAIAGEKNPKSELSARLSVLYRILLSLREGDITKVDEMKTVLKRILGAVPAERAALLLNLNDDESMEPAAWMRKEEARSQTSPTIVISKTICEQAVEEKSAILVGDAQSDDRFKKSDSVAAETISSAIAVPLMAGEEVFGLLYVDAQDKNVELSTEDLSFIGAVAAEISYSIWLRRMSPDADDDDSLPGGSGSSPGGGDTLLYAGRALEKIIQQCAASSPTLSQALSEEDLMAAKGAWKQVKRGLKRINKVVSDMMGYVDAPTPELAKIDINKVIMDTLDAFQAELTNADIDVETDIRHGLHDRFLDEDGLYKALINVVENSYDALLAQKDGRLTIRCYETAQGALIIEVIDNGPGLNPKTAARVFQPFNAGPGSRGIGMGLAMTRRLLENMDGSVTLSSEKGKGATVTMIFSPSTKA